MDIRDWMLAIENCELSLPRERPSLLFDAADLPLLRRRAQEREGFLDELRCRCEKLLAFSPEQPDLERASQAAAAAQTMAEGYMLLGIPEWAAWAKRRCEALLEAESWTPPVHGNARCDHVRANVAALVGYTYDLLASTFTAQESQVWADHMRRQILEPFLEVTRNRSEWWTPEAVVTNWKIMTCGDAGLGICAFADHWPEAREALALAARGVLETLDAVPPEGDWPEGVGYWLVTLFMGLRFARALRRLTSGRINLFEHPILRTTGDFPLLLSTPGGRVYNFADNDDTLRSAYAADAMRLLAVEVGRPDWLFLARSLPMTSLLGLALDDPTEPAEPSTRRTARFPHSGIATMRSGWGPHDTFVGFRCGPSSIGHVGHAHLDANSFVLEARSVPLLLDEGLWPYGGTSAFFDPVLRWNWDNTATVGHNSLLVDGQGQTFGEQYPGRLLELETGEGWMQVAGNASLCYPDLLRKFVRALIFFPPHLLVVRDVIECEGERHVESLLHHAGEVRSQGLVSVVEADGVTLTVVPFLLPSPEQGWRVSDVVRTSYYHDHEFHAERTGRLRYRSFAPLRAGKSFEFLFGFNFGSTPFAPWEFWGQPGAWELTTPDGRFRLRPDGDAVAVIPGTAFGVEHPRGSSPL